MMAMRKDAQGLRRGGGARRGVAMAAALMLAMLLFAACSVLAPLQTPAAYAARTGDAGADATASNNGDAGSTYSDAGVNQDDIGSLSSRFKSLDALERATDETDNVVTSTRVGVLIAVNRALDGATVSFSGEVVGDIMNADADHKWLNVLGSDGSCIGVLVDNDMAQRVTHVGSYNATGTTLQVRGVYSVDCAEHQGELDVHAVDVRVLDAGGAVTHFADKDDVAVGLRMCAIAFVLMIIFFVIRHMYDRREHNERKAKLLGGALDSPRRLLDIFKRGADDGDARAGKARGANIRADRRHDDDKREGR